jgi:hypothetical protein
LIAKLKKILKFKEFGLKINFDDVKRIFNCSRLNISKRLRLKTKVKEKVYGNRGIMFVFLRIFWENITSPNY